MVAAPAPYECVGQCLLENAAVAMAGGEAEDEALVVTFRFERRRRPLSSHNPVVIGLLRIFCAKIILRDVREDSQRLFFALFDQLHA